MNPPCPQSGTKNAASIKKMVAPPLHPSRMGLFHALPFLGVSSL